MSDQSARHAIDGAIEYGRQGINKPPSADHWLMPYWELGRAADIKEIAMAWQPIETAPKDGNLMILGWAGSKSLAANVDLGRWKQAHIAADAWASIHGVFFSYQPTHWMPLPEPPKEQP